MLPASATNGHRDIAAMISRQCIQPPVQKISNFGQHARDIWLLCQELGHRRVAASECPQGGFVMRVRQHAHIEHVICITGDPPLESEGFEHQRQLRVGCLNHVLDVALQLRRADHAGRLSPFAFVSELREWFDGPIALSGAIATGRSILAALAVGADLAYIGTPWVATKEANADPNYKQGIVEGRASDIVYSNLFTGVHGNYLRGSIERAGLDPDNLPEGDLKTMNFGSGGNTKAKAWKDIWGSGQGIGAVTAVDSVADRVDRLEAEFNAAKAELAAKLR